MLASSCFSYDSLLAHAPAQKRLPQRVVDLVRACVVQILSLQIDFWPAILAARPHSKMVHAQGGNLIEKGMYTLVELKEVDYQWK